MATKTVHLTIPAPCQQRWQDMTADGTGRFCASCQKTVVDFSTLNNQQVVSLLAQQKGPECGRFRAGQLNRALSITPSTSWLPVRLFGVLAAGLLEFQTARANLLPALPESNRQHTTDLATHTASSNLAEDVVPDSVRVITGRVIEQATKSGIPGATVTIKGMTRGANTDAEGYFQVRIPADLSSDQLILQIASIGYLSQEVQLRPKQTPPLVIRLNEDSVGLSQVVIMGRYKKLTFFQRLRNWLRARG